MQKVFYLYSNQTFLQKATIVYTYNIWRKYVFVWHFPFGKWTPFLWLNPDSKKTLVLFLRLCHKNVLVLTRVRVLARVWDSVFRLEIQCPVSLSSYWNECQTPSWHRPDLRCLVSLGYHFLWRRGRWLFGESCLPPLEPISSPPSRLRRPGHHPGPPP